MEKQKKVLDASVIVKGFVKEIDSDKAIKLINAHVNKEILIIVPPLLSIEVLNSFRFKNKDIDYLKKINKDLKEFQFKIEETNDSILNKAIEISLENNITIYDSIYVAIAQMNGCPLITADTELYKIPNVLPLKET